MTRRTRISSRNSTRASTRCATALEKVAAPQRTGRLSDLLAPEIVLQGLAPVAQLRAPQGGEDAVCGPLRRERYSERGTGTTSTPTPASEKISFANSYQEQEPELVRW